MDLIYFTIKELSKSATANKLGIDNTPTREAEENLKTLIREVLDPARALYGKPIFVSNGYRSKALNTAVGGSESSQHMLGEAADIFCDNNEALFALIRDNLSYDQLIFETKDKKDKNGKVIGKVEWIHISYRKGRLRKMAFRMHNGKRI
jgi:hypothetical protein